MMVKHVRLQAWAGRGVKLLTAMLALGAIQHIANAVPAAPTLKTYTQPDGTTFQVRLRGDEWFHWHETPDGHPITKDTQSGYWFYALPNGAGVSTRSLSIVGKQTPPTDPWLPTMPARASRLRDAVYNKRMATRGVGTRAVAPTGVAPVPVILVNFSDTQPKFTPAQFNTLLFGPGKSMKSYYTEVSKGRFTVSGGPNGVVGWYTAKNPHDYYGRNLPGDGNADSGGNDAHSAELVIEAVQAAEEAGVDFTPYDTDRDGFVDVVNIVHQGTDEADTGNATDIWSAQSDLQTSAQAGDGSGIYVTSSGKKVNKFVMQPELSADGSMVTVGVFCHEYGHALGLPDLYDVDYSSHGLGAWSLMAGGTNNGRNGDTPAHMDAWCKLQMGWLTPTVPTNNIIRANIPNAETTNFAYKLWTNGAAGKEYFLVENRQRIGFDSALPATGLLIWHIDDARTNNTNNDNSQEWYPGRTTSGHYRVALVQADGLFNLERKQNHGDAGDPYPGTTNNRTFDSTSNPNSRSYAGVLTNVAVRNISPSASTMTADIFVRAVATSAGPPNDNFANAQALTTNTNNSSSGRVTGTSVGATKETGEVVYAGNSGSDGGKSVWYKWTAAVNGRLTVTTAGSNFDTLLAAYTGNAVNALTLVVGNDDISDTAGTSSVTLNVVAGRTYYFEVDGYNGVTGSVVVNWTFVPAPPSNNNFASAQVISGRSGRVIGSNVGANKETGEPNHAGGAGGASVWYKWTATAAGNVTFKTAGSNFDTLLAVYTGTALNALTPVASNDDVIENQVRTSSVTFNAIAGRVYYIAVDGYQAESGPIVLTWAVPPPNDNFANAQAISGRSGQATGTTAGATRETGEPNHESNAGGASVWYKWTAPGNGSATFNTRGSNFDTILGIYTGTSVRGLTLVVGNDDVSSDIRTSSASFNAVANRTYYIAVDSYGGISGNLRLNWSLVEVTEAESSIATAPASSTKLVSSAVASAATSSVQLRFSSALNAESASDVAHYGARINGQAVTVESASYNNTTRTVTLGVPEGALRVGDSVILSWHRLRDATGKAVTGQTQPLTAR